MLIKKNLNRIVEKKLNIVDLIHITKFCIINDKELFNNCDKIVLNFSFKEIDFNKKRAIPFFVILEMITSQTAYGSRSNKIILMLDIKKNSFVGCKVTLRHEKLYLFIDNFINYITRIQNINLNVENILNNNHKSFSKYFQNIWKFYQLNKMYYEFIKSIHINFIFKNIFIEKKLFYLNSIVNMPFKK